MHSEIVYLLLAFALGYLTGRADSLYRVLRDKFAPAPKAGFFSEQAPYCRPQQNGQPAPKISIDERKVVTEISTAGIAKSSEAAEELGTKTVQSDNIDASVSKLAQLKGR
jgi:hypothetical protein